jgi:hypothetical protein
MLKLNPSGGRRHPTEFYVACLHTSGLDRGLRGLWIDAGKVCNELLWALAERELRPHITPAFDEPRMNAVLGMGADNLGRIPMYAISFAGASG